MKEPISENFHRYCKLIEKKIKYINQDEIETAKVFEKLIKKYNIKKVKRVSLPMGNTNEDIGIGTGIGTGADSYSYSSSSDFFFNYYYEKREPIIIKNLSHKIGKCIKTYNNGNIIKHIGSTKVSIHISNSKFLNNVNKNFCYTLSSITKFIQLIGQEDKKKKKFSLRYDEGRKEIYITFCKGDILWEKKKNKEIDESTNVINTSNNKKDDIRTKTFHTFTYPKSKKFTTHNDEQRTLKDDSTNQYGEMKVKQKCIPFNCTMITPNEKRENKRYGNHNTHKDSENYYYYYRSLGTNQFKDVSNIKKMNNFVKDNFFLPAQIYPPHDKFEFFSSILRIGQTNIFIWLHYDIPDNFLIQVKGRKKILLIPPKFVKYFHIINSSSSYNLFNILTKKKLTKKEKIVKKIIHKFAFVADLYQGDILFIPSLWLHYVYNMPAHTHVKKSYKSYHQYLHIRKEEGCTQFSHPKKTKRKGKNATSRIYQQSGNFEIRKKKKKKKKSTLKAAATATAKPYICQSNGHVPLNLFMRLKRRKTRALRTLSHNTEDRRKLRLLPHLYNLLTHKNTPNVFISSSNDMEPDELINHYSHLENSEEYLKNRFNILIPETNLQHFNIEEKHSNMNRKNNTSIGSCNHNTKLCVNEYTQSKPCADVKEKKNNANNSGEIYYPYAKLNISINYFFRKRKERYLFNKKDLYGNQDINCASQIFKKIQNDIQPILLAPPKYKNFYLQKLQGLFYSNLDDDYI
ncbi:hypothetical protein, conserved [Plasmodium gonderi]|uniref:JmjC domain-containing protein n=1 Tax=Plasmodium gonderi TaxID=77519 RepID=A0A1Y1JMD1_PLAGO|nr:hypothetical protein, conserved [Plasmodium gonderi]GAW81992.1 hypothetical protein, conserved [Plasmodium gonderi]